MVLNTHPPTFFPVANEDVAGLLKGYGITPTRQRVQIASFLFQRPQHVTAEQLLQETQALGAHVSRATIYNTLALFIKKGLVKEILVDHERVFYDSDNRVHHHAYNIDNGELIDLDSNDIRLQHPSKIGDDLEVVDASLVLRVSSR